MRLTRSHDAASLTSRDVIARYTRPEIGAVWTDEARFQAMRDVEVAAAEALEGPTDEDLAAIRSATFTVEAIAEREKVTDHDTAAFVDVLAASAGPAGRWIHYGLTSSDVIDTALALQIARAGEVVVPAARALATLLAERAREFADTLCVGRTHGVQAEPTTFGLKLAGHAMETHRNAQRLESAFADATTGKISGAVGTYATLGPDYERRVLERLGLAAEPVSTQVVPRDRHATLLSAIALAGAGLERFATEIRHLQRTEVREVEEPFGAGQKGSSAMPHKRNPVVSERICGLARLLRGYAQVGLEDVALWHERDISHSSAERVVLPDATIVLDQMLHLARRVAGGMTVHADRMRANLELTSGALFSQRVLLALVAAGRQRDDAYRIVQRLAQQAWDTGTPLRALLEREPGVELDLDEVFDYGYYTRHVPEVLARLEVIGSAGPAPVWRARRVA
jgi:adenylosuccinate lyase